MEISVAFVDCPGYMDKDGAARCGLPAVVEDRYTMTSTDGPLESARIRCPRGHYFNGPVESLTWEKAAGAHVVRTEATAGPPGGSALAPDRDPRGYGFTGSAGAAESSRR